MTIGRIVVDLLARTGSFETDLNRASKLAAKRAKEIDASLAKTAKAVGVALGTAAVAAGTAIAVMVKNSIDAADRLNDISQRLGVGTEALSAWGYAAQQSGTDIEQLNTGLTRFTKNVAAALDGESRQGEIFKTLGINVKDAAGKLRSVEELLPEVADKFKTLNNATLESSLSMELFGKSGANLLQFLNLGSDGLSDMEKRARELGIVISQDTASAADEFNDEVANLKALLSGFATQLAGELLPTMTDLVKGLRDLIKDGSTASQIASDLSGAFRFLAGAASFAYAKLDGIGKIVEGLSQGFFELNNAARAVFSGNFALAANILKNSTSDALIGEGAAQFATGARAKKGGNLPDFSGVTSGFSQDLQGQAAAIAAQRKEAQALEDAVTKLLGGGNDKPKAKKSAGKSDAQREAEQLKGRYDQLVASLNEQIALTGVVSETEQLRWQLANTELSKLSEAEKANLLTLQQSAEFRQKDYEAMQEQIRLDEERQKQIDEGRDRTDELIQDMQFELDLMKMSNDERAKAIALRYADKDATDAQRAAIADLAVELERSRELSGFMDDFRGSLADAFTDFVTGAKSAKEAFADFFDDMAERITRMIAERWIEQLFGAQGSTGAGTTGGNWIGAAFSALFGGARANGGPVMDGGSYLVGERGPELFIPRTSGSIVPAGQTARIAGGGNTLHQTFVVSGTPDRRTREQMARQSGREASRGMSRTGR